MLQAQAAIPGTQHLQGSWGAAPVTNEALTFLPLDFNRMNEADIKGEVTVLSPIWFAGADIFISN